MNTRHNALQIRKALCDLSEFLFERRVVQQILDCVQSSHIALVHILNRSKDHTYRALISEASRRGMHSQMRNSRLPNHRAVNGNHVNRVIANTEWGDAS